MFFYDAFQNLVYGVLFFVNSFSTILWPDLLSHNNHLQINKVTEDSST